MSGNPNPAIAPYTDRSASEIIAFVKLYIRETIPAADAIRNGDWSGQFGGLHLLSNGADYDINTSDTTTADDGDNCIIDFNGLRFFKKAPVVNPVKKLIATAGVDVTIADTETADEIEINNTGAAGINVFLPDASLRMAAITITDVGGNAASFNIVVKPKLASGQTIMTGSSYDIDSNGGGIKLTPNSSKTGYK